MEDIATFDYAEIQGIPVVHASGEIDLSNINLLDAILEKATASPAVAVILSLDGVTYLGSTTFHALEDWGERLNQSGVRLFVVKPASSLGKRLFDLICLDGQIRTFDSLETAMQGALQRKSS